MGRSTRSVSANMAALLMERLITQLELNDIDRGVRQEYILDNALRTRR